MSVIKAFKGVYYNPERHQDMSKLATPPYDVISQEQKDVFQHLSPFNFTHIDLPNSENGIDCYTNAKNIFDKWIKEQVLIKDRDDSVYFYKQEFKVMGQKHIRSGFIALLELQDEEASTVKPHEKTHQSAVDDRLELTKALEGNLSSIFVGYSDKHRIIDAIYEKNVIVEKPMFDFVDRDGVRHILWKYSDKSTFAEMAKVLLRQNLFIADGHHRYRVACEYRKLRQAQNPNHTGTEDYNYVMTYFTNLDSKDLQIFPMHRIIRSITDSMDFLEDYFRIDKIKDKDEMGVFLAKAGLNEHAFGLYTRDGYRLLRLKSKAVIDENIVEGSADYRSLDATILKQLVFDKLNIKSDDILYTKDFTEGVDLVDTNKADAVFLMNPVRISQLKAIALNGEKMPPKTTYFYPKIYSGLTVYSMS